MLSRFFTVLQDLLTGVRSDPSLGTFSVSLLEWLHVLGERGDMFGECAQRLHGVQFVSGQDFEAKVVNGGGQSGMAYIIGARAAAMLARESEVFVATLAEDKKALLNNFCRLFVTQDSIPVSPTNCGNCMNHPEASFSPPFSPPPSFSPPSFPALASRNVMLHHQMLPPSTPLPSAREANILTHSSSLQPNNGGVLAPSPSADATDMRVQALERQLREATEAVRQQHEQHMRMMQCLLAQSSQSAHLTTPTLSPPSPPAERGPPERVHAQSLSKPSGSACDQHEEECMASDADDDAWLTRSPYTLQDLREKGAAFFASDLVVFGDASKVYVPSDKLRAAFVNYTGGSVPVGTNNFKRLLTWLRHKNGLGIELEDSPESGKTRTVRRVWRGVKTNARFVFGVDVAAGRGRTSAAIGCQGDGLCEERLPHDAEQKKPASSCQHRSSATAATASFNSSAAYSSAPHTTKDEAISNTAARLRKEGAAFFSSDSVVFGDPSKVYVPSSKLRDAFVQYFGEAVATGPFKSLLRWLRDERRLPISFEETSNGSCEHQIWRGKSQFARYVHGVDLADGRDKTGGSTNGQKRDQTASSREHRSVTLSCSSSSSLSLCSTSSSSSSSSSSSPSPPSSSSSSSNTPCRYPKRQRTATKQSIAYVSCQTETHAQQKTVHHKHKRNTRAASSNKRQMSTCTLTTEELRAKGEEFLRSSLVVFGEHDRTYVPFSVLRYCFLSFINASCALRRFRSLLDWLAKNREPRISVLERSQSWKRELMYRGKKKTGFVWVKGVDVVEGRGEDSASACRTDARNGRERREEEGSGEEEEEEDNENDEETSEDEESGDDDDEEEEAQAIIKDTTQEAVCERKETNTANTETKNGEESDDSGEESERTESEEESEEEDTSESSEEGSEYEYEDGGKKGDDNGQGESS